MSLSSQRISGGGSWRRRAGRRASGTQQTPPAPISPSSPCASCNTCWILGLDSQFEARQVLVCLVISQWFLLVAGLIDPRFPKFLLSGTPLLPSGLRVRVLPYG